MEYKHANHPFSQKAMHKTMYPSSFSWCGVVNIDVNSLNSVTQTYSPYLTPTQRCLASTYGAKDDNNVTIVASNCASAVEYHANAMQIAPTHAVADTGATSIFVWLVPLLTTFVWQRSPYTSASQMARRYYRHTYVMLTSRACHTN
jgi:hypothetical protein